MLKRLIAKYRPTPKELISIGLSGLFAVISSVVSYQKMVRVEVENRKSIKLVQEQCTIEKKEAFEMFHNCLSELEFVLLTKTNFDEYLNQSELDSLLNIIEKDKEIIRLKIKSDPLILDSSIMILETFSISYKGYESN